MATSITVPAVILGALGLFLFTRYRRRKFHQNSSGTESTSPTISSPFWKWNPYFNYGNESALSKEEVQMNAMRTGSILADYEESRRQTKDSTNYSFNPRNSMQQTTMNTSYPNFSQISVDPAFYPIFEKDLPPIPRRDSRVSSSSSLSSPSLPSPSSTSPSRKSTRTSVRRSLRNSLRKSILLSNSSSSSQISLPKRESLSVVPPVPKLPSSFTEYTLENLTDITALMNYDPEQIDEISLRLGDIISICKIYDDGWALGLSKFN